MPEEPLNPSVVVAGYTQRYAENDWGILAAINLCIQAAGGIVTSYPANTGGIIRALVDLSVAVGSISGGSTVLNFSMTASEALAKGDLVYINSSGQAAKAIASGTRDQATVIGMASATTAAGSLGNITLMGGQVGLTTLTPGALYYLSAVTAGAYTVTPPSGSGQYVTRIGEALSATTMMMGPEEPTRLA